MTDLTEAVRRLKELQQDVERLKAGSEDGGEIRYLRSLAERSTTGVTVETGKDADVTDRSETTDVVDAHFQDADVTDRSEASDTVQVTTDAAGSWTWRQSNYRFDEFGRN